MPCCMTIDFGAGEQDGSAAGARLTCGERIATLTLSRPPVNAIDDALVTQIHGILDALERCRAWTVLHVRSDQHVFCAGADLRRLRAHMAASDPGATMRVAVHAIQALFDRVAALPGVTLAEIGGAAMGGGLELALACDLRIAAREARLGLPETGLGLLPGAGGTQRLTALCGRGTATRMILAGETVTGAEARDLGLVQWAVPGDRLAAEARALVETVAERPVAALAAAKDCIAAAGEPARDGFALEVEASARLAAEPETRARVSAFLGDAPEGR